MPSKKMQNAPEMSESVPTTRHANALVELRPLESRQRLESGTERMAVAPSG